MYSFYSTKSSAHLIWSKRPKDHCPVKLKSRTPSSKLKPCTLWTVETQGKTSGNWVLLVDGDVALLFVGISVSHFSIPTQQCCLLKRLDAFVCNPASRSENLTYIFWKILLKALICTTSPTWPFISQSWISMLQSTWL